MRTKKQTEKDIKRYNTLLDGGLVPSRELCERIEKGPIKNRVYWHLKYHEIIDLDDPFVYCLWLFNSAAGEWQSECVQSWIKGETPPSHINIHTCPWCLKPIKEEHKQKV